MGRAVSLPTRSDRTVPPSDWERRIPERLVAGDEHALGEVYDQYSDFVY